MSEKLKIVYRPLQELSPYAHNARTHSTEQVAQLVESIKQFGWTNPVLIDEKGEIIAGHGRVMAAEMLKMDSVPVIVLSGLTDEQKKAYRLADNRLPMNAGWDEDLLRMELSDLINADFDVSLTGFIPTEIDELLTDVLPGTRINSGESGWRAVQVWHCWPADWEMMPPRWIFWRGWHHCAHVTVILIRVTIPVMMTCQHGLLPVTRPG
ncbi:ParB/Srx family N-terminal domain-containing protein [Escherichia coli]